MPPIKPSTAAVPNRTHVAPAPSPGRRVETPAASAQGWQPRPAARASTAPGARPAREFRTYQLSVPTDRAGESLSALNGFAATLFDDVTLKMGKKRILGLETSVELLGIGPAAELDQLQNVIRRTADANAGPGRPVESTEQSRFVSMDHPSVPRP